LTIRPDGGDEVTATRLCKDPEAREARPGEVVPVVYLSDDPRKDSWPFDGRDERREHRQHAGLLWVFCGLWAFGIGLGELLIAWERLLGRYGVVAWARVLETGIHRRRRGGTRHWVRYEFQPAGGRPRSSTAKVPSAVREAHPPGTLLPLLYLLCCPWFRQPLGSFWAVTFPRRQGPPG
jgi:hypothetical protein